MPEIPGIARPMNHMGRRGAGVRLETGSPPPGKISCFPAQSFLLFQEEMLERR